MEQVVLEPVVRGATRPGYRYFAPGSAVVSEGDRRQVFVGGTLVGEFAAGDQAARNALLVQLCQDPRVHLGRLAKAFELSEERVRQLRRKFEQSGLGAVIQIRRGGREPVVTARMRARMVKLFAAGEGLDTVAKKFPQISRMSVARELRRWRAERAREAATVDTASAPALGEAAQRSRTVAITATDQLGHDVTTSGATTTPSVEDEAATAATSDAGVEPVGASDGCGSSTAEEGGNGAAGPSLHTRRELPLAALEDEPARHVQHVGIWIVLALLHAWGVYEYFERLRARLVHDRVVEARHLGSTALRVAIDATVGALVIGQGTVEGVRRLGTASVRTLLRIALNAPGPEWVRTVLHRFADEVGGTCHHATTFALLRRAHRERDARAVYYVDNHLRRYTGQFVVRKGWRMQDKRPVAGASDYWVHDEDGRPLLREPSPNHDSLTSLLRPIARLLRAGLDFAGAERTRIMLVFDRAGAFPNELAALRNEGFDFVTYERGPYPRLLRTAFDRKLSYGDEVLCYTELAQKNLGAGRGRVRRIHVLTPDGNQLNVLCVSDADAEFVVLTLLRRWARQENQFKYGVERLKLNQLDGRGTHLVPDDEEIPNPARRRLDLAITIARQQEGEARRQLASLDPADARRAKWDAELQRVCSLQAELLKQRPTTPKRLLVGESELAGKLVRHDLPYKLVIDTLRLLIANVEGELAATLSPLLPRATEAKKTLANLLAAPGVVRVTAHHVTIRLGPAGTRAEQRAFRVLLAGLNRQHLTLPGDPSRRPLRFAPQSE